MKEFKNTDAGDFVVMQTSGYETMPPEQIWSQIENHIPHYSAGEGMAPLYKVIIGTVSLSAVMLFAMIYLHYHQGNTPFHNAVPVTSTDSLITSTHSDKVSPSPVIIEVAKSSEIEKQQPSDIKRPELSAGKKVKIENSSPKPVCEKSQTELTYTINASGHRNVSEISFLDDNDQVVLTEKNPHPNEFGFFVINISKIKKGTYSIMLTTPEGRVLHKKETFR